ncbi:MAG TPA: alpha/beta fold hydrolase [Chloroflexaceae bacterium]|nr:alpha/beta fold hydrolase [Chloroflexaceae bacterium]
MSAAGAQLAHHRVRLGPHTVGYGVAGAGPPVVLVHGLSGSTRWWRRNVPALAARLRVYVVDLVGFGASRGSRFALAEAAGLLAAWMDAVGLGRAGLVGHSMGGYVVAELAAARPELVARLLLLDAAVLPFCRSFAQHGLGLARELLQLPPAFLPVLVGDALRAGPLTVWAAAQEVMRADLSAKLGHISAPTMVIWGARDRVVPLALGRALADALPRSELAVIEGAGHNAMWDRPDAFNRLALRFLAGAPRRDLSP